MKAGEGFYYGFGSVDVKRGMPGKYSFSYEAWSSLLKRCFDKKCKRHHYYKDCTVDERFKEFHDFDAWARQQIGYGVPGFQLDKDILVKGNRHYGPDTCVFIPQDLNVVVHGKHKKKHSTPAGVRVEDRRPIVRFVAKIGINGRTINLGTFDTPELAFLAYKAAKEERIKEVAEQWKSKIDPRTYLALMSRVVEIED